MPDANAEDGMSAEVTFRPLTQDRWGDLEALFGPKGACGGCWCMWWRLTASEYDREKGEGNMEALKGIVQSGQVPGILAYRDEEPVGWCSIAPREHFPRLNRSPTLKPVDDLPVWSVVCFFISRRARRTGMSEALLRAALDYAGGRGASIVEGYPVEPTKDRYPDIGAYTGFASTFCKVGFREVLRRRETRPIMRYEF